MRKDMEDMDMMLPTTSSIMSTPRGTHIITTNMNMLRPTIMGTTMDMSTPRDNTGMMFMSMKRSMSLITSSRMT